MSRFTTRVLLASALIAVPATGLVAAPASADVVTPAAAPTAKKRKNVYMNDLRTGKSGSSTKRYQVYLRNYAKEVGISYRSINPHGATGYYGTETRNLTKAVTRHVTRKAPRWTARTNTKVSVHPNSAFVKLLGLRPLWRPKAPAKAPVANSNSSTSAKAPAANKAWPAIVTATIATKPSSWKGPALKHPRTKKTFAYNVSRWANLVRAVMREHGVADKYLVGILAQIQQESGGDPDAVNNWDSNAKKGTPSKGLLQVILPTYKYYAKAGYKTAKYQTVPYTNIWAALNYVIDRYGMSKFASWNAGYNQGY